MNLASSRLELLQEALTHSHLPATPAGTDLWELLLGTSRSTRALLQLDGDWLSLCAPCLRASNGRTRHMTRLPELLQWNTKLPPPLKFCLAKTGQMEVRADLPLALGQPLDRRIADACQGLHLAHVIYAENVALRIGSRPADDLAAKEPSVRLREVLEQTGWKSSVRSGAFSVELEVEQGAYRTRVWEEGSQVRLQAELAECEGFSPVCLAGISMLMLTASRMLRTIRFGLCRADETLTAVAEVVLQGLPMPKELTAAFQALSTACAQVGAEMTHFDNEQIAKEYLRIRGTTRKEKETA